MRRFFVSLLHTLATGYILFYFSECMFWTRPKPEDSPGGYVTTWLVYSAAGSVLLWLLRWAGRETVWTVMLAGAVFGWITEGIVVQTVYQNFPFQVFWTGTAWHALISAVLGWYGLRRVMAAQNPWLTSAAATGFGVFWGVWGLCWRALEPATAADSITFAGYAFAFTAALLPALAIEYGVSGRAQPLPVWFQAILGLGFIALYILQALIPIFPLACLLPPLLAVTLAALWGWRRAESSAARAAEPVSCIGWLQIPFMLALPFTAACVYALGVSLDLVVQTNILVFCLTTPTGIALWAWAVVRGLRGIKTSPAKDAAAPG